MDTGPSKNGGWLWVTAPLWPVGLARVLYGLLWWQQSKWKVPSDDFGRKSGGGLWYWVHQEIQFPTITAYKDFLVNVMIPHWTFFGYMTLAMETFIGTTLILGVFTRLGALAALGMATNITLGILSVPHEWGWTYAMLIAFAAVFLLTGVGLTNACDLACAHCYRDTERVDQLSESQVLGVCDALPVRSVNLGTGENGLHPEYAAIVRAMGARGVKLSLTSNGYTIERSSDETLGAFREIEVSIDFPTASEQDAFRGAGNWRRVMAGIERAQRVGITVTVLSG